KTFLVPVVIDETGERSASVPEKFRELQWTRLPGGTASPAFVERIRQLLVPVATAAPEMHRSAPAPVRGPRSHSRRDRWFVLGLLLVAPLAIGAWYAATRWSAARAPGPALTSSPTMPAVEPIPQKSIAVLPFLD